MGKGLKMKPKFDLDYFIHKFEAIPHSQWTTNDYTNAQGQHCALGHCSTHTGEEAALRQLTEIEVSYVNDGKRGMMKLGKRPRTRVLRYLKQLKKEREKK